MTDLLARVKGRLRVVDLVGGPHPDRLRAAAPDP